VKFADIKQKVSSTFNKVIPVFWSILFVLIITTGLGCFLGWLIKSFLKIIGVI